MYELTIDSGASVYGQNIITRRATYEKIPTFHKGCFPLDAPTLGIAFLNDQTNCERIKTDLTTVDPGMRVDILFNGKGHYKNPFGDVKRIREWPAGIKKAPLQPHFSYCVGIMAFVEAIQHAHNLGAQWFNFIEWDCLFRRKNWLRDNWIEHVLFNQGTLVSGTPVIIRPRKSSEILDCNLTRYCDIFQRSSGYHPEIITYEAAIFRIFPNGALAWYNVDFLMKAFSTGISLLQRGWPMPETEQYCHHIAAFDYYIGKYLPQQFGDIVALTKVGWLCTSYSGCGNHYISEERRVDMFKGDNVVIMHQYKH
jgi:hypothetical protein